MRRRTPWEPATHALSTGVSSVVYDADGTALSMMHLDEADARLIAAAPDLLAAAKIVAADKSCRSHTYRFLWAAINKAESSK